MHEAESRHVAVMRRAQRNAFVVLLAANVDLFWSLDNRAAEQASELGRLEETAGGGIVEGHGRMCGGSAGHVAPIGLADLRHPAIHDNLVPGGQLEGQTASVSVRAQVDRRRTTGVHD